MEEEWHAKAVGGGDEDVGGVYAVAEELFDDGHDEGSGRRHGSGGRGWCGFWGAPALCAVGAGWISELRERSR